MARDDKVWQLAVRIVVFCPASTVDMLHAMARSDKFISNDLRVARVVLVDGGNFSEPPIC